MRCHDVEESEATAMCQDTELKCKEKGKEICQDDEDCHGITYYNDNNILTNGTEINICRSSLVISNDETKWKSIMKYPPFSSAFKGKNYNS